MKHSLFCLLALTWLMSYCPPGLADDSTKSCTYGLFAKKAGTVPITKFKVFSERCSGSYYIQSLFETNLELSLFPFCHKHFAPWFDLPQERYLGPKNYYTFENTEDVLFVVIFRNPYDWARSFNATPWHAAEHLHNIDFSKFIRSTWEATSGEKDEIIRVNQSFNPLLDKNPTDGSLFKNIFELRTVKGKNYLKIKERVKNCYFIQYEVVRDHPQEVLKEAEALFSIKQKPLYKPVTSYKGVEKLGEYAPKTYSPISQEDLNYINSQLDEAFEKSIGYSIITDSSKLDQQ